MKQENRLWQHKIKIKHLFESETTPELVIKICTELNTQLEKIKKKYENKNDGIYEELEINIDNFEFLKHLADGTIPEQDWADYSFYGDFEKEFNGYLSQLYDLADENKLIWIG